MTSVSSKPGKEKGMDGNVKLLMKTDVRSALEIFTKENSVSDWAQTQYALGNAITSLFDLYKKTSHMN